MRLTTSTKLKLAYVGLAAVDTWLSGIADKKAHYARFVTKPLLMPTLTASLVTNPKAADSPLRTSTVAHRVVVTWSAEWSLNGGPLQPVNGTVTTSGPATPLRIAEASPALSGSGH